MPIPVIGINQNFEIKFTVKRDELREAMDILDENKYSYRCEKTRYPAFILLITKVNIRKGEVLRRLLTDANILRYD